MLCWAKDETVYAVRVRTSYEANLKDRTPQGIGPDKGSKPYPSITPIVIEGFFFI